jgi:ribosome-associated heat shock protein Hsp15
MAEGDRMRLDRWLWAARFFRTRAMAKTAIDGGKVTVNGVRAKPAKEIGIGDQVEVRRGWTPEVVQVTALARERRSAALAAGLFAETDASIARREREAARRKMERAGLKVPQLKPDKHGRRALARLKQQGDQES